jgi:hypothetical protein
MHQFFDTTIAAPPDGGVQTTSSTYVLIHIIKLITAKTIKISLAVKQHKTKFLIIRQQLEFHRILKLDWTTDCDVKWLM